VIGCTLLVLAGLASQAAKTSVSRSGEKRLEVEKCEDGSFLWTLRTPAGVQWEKARPHYLQETFVCEDGTVVAYGPDNPKAGWDERSAALTILDGEGAVRMLEFRPFQKAVGGRGPYPRPEGVLVWETLDTCAFWMGRYAEPDQLLTYSLSNGGRKGAVELEWAFSTGLPTAGTPPLRSLLAPGGNELMLATFATGVVALFQADGHLLWRSRELPTGQFFGEAREIESSARDLRCRIDVDVLGRASLFGPSRSHVDTLALRFQRDDSGAWIWQED